MNFNRLRRLYYLLALMALPLLCFSNGPQDALFAKGNALYAKARYEGALYAYRQLLDDGFQSAAVYFNMGDACYKNGDIPSALLYFEKAHRIDPGNDDINFNLKYVGLKTADKIDEAPEFFLTRWWKGFILSLSIKILAVWSVIFVLLATGSLVVYFFTGSVSLKKNTFYTAAVFFFLGISTIFIANRQLSYFDGDHGAIIFSALVNVKSAPAEQAKTLFVIHDGAKVNILDTSNGWLKISLANGNVGWIKQEVVKEI